MHIRTGFLEVNYSYYILRPSDFCNLAECAYSRHDNELFFHRACLSMVCVYDLAIDLRSGAGIGIGFDLQMPVVVDHLIMVRLIL